MAFLGGCFGHSNHEFKIFGVNEKQVIRVAILDFRIANLKLLRKLVSSVLWESDFQGLEIHECWSIFKSNLLGASTHHAKSQARRAEEQLG